jgi:hypothetical protein
MNKLERTTTGYRVSVELQDENLEEIVCGFLNETMFRLRQDLEALKRKRKRKPYEQEDLDHNTAMLSHCAAVYDYYGGNLKGRQRE